MGDLASFTCPALDRVLALLSPCSSLGIDSASFFKGTELLGAGETERSLALGPGPDGIRTNWKYEMHPKSFQGVRPRSDCDPMAPMPAVSRGRLQSFRATQGGPPNRALQRRSCGERDLCVALCYTDLVEGSASSPPSRNVNTWKNSPGFTWKKFNGVNKRSRKSPLIQKAVGWRAEPGGSACQGPF